jgi:hypothetical protein
LVFKFNGKFSEGRQYESCRFCIWLKQMRDSKLPSLSETELEAWGAHLILQHEFEG